jgi:hypothetical protein
MDNPAIFSFSECQGTDPNENPDYQAWLANNGWAQASDLCGSVTWENNTGSVEWSGPCPMFITVTFTATDDCGNRRETQASYIIEDTTPPNIETYASDAQSDCTGANPDESPDYQEWLANNGGATASDACGDVTWSNTSLTSSWSGDCSKSILITFTAKDVCELEIQTTATFTINDTEAPSIISYEINNVAECKGSIPDFNSGYQDWLSQNGGLSAEDGCGNGLFWGNNSGEVLWTTNGCDQSIEVTFTVSDGCGNSNQGTSTFTIHDSSPPEVIGSLNELTFEGCGSEAAPAPVSSLEELEGLPGTLQVNDLCSSVLSVTVDQEETGSCHVTITRTYHVADDCGNVSDVIQIINIDDSQAPDVTGNLDVMNVEGCEESDAPGAVTSVAELNALSGNLNVSDLCTSEGELVLTYDQTVSGSCPITISRIYHIEDLCGNSTDVEHTISVGDTEAPTSSGNLDVLAVEGCDFGALPQAVSTIDDLEALAGNLTLSDGCTSHGDLVVTSDDSAPVSNCPIVITRTYHVTDGCGNTTDVDQFINLSDTQAPAVTGSLDQTNITGCDVSGVPDAVTSVAALEALDGDLQIIDACISDGDLAVSSSESTSGTCPIVVTRVYTVSDLCSNASIDIVHTFSIAAPNVVFECGTNVTVPACASQATVDAAYTSFLASTTASGGCNGSLTNNAPANAASRCGGSVNVTWTYSSNCDDDHVCTLSFTVTGDNIPPAISPQASSATVQCNGSGNISDLNSWLNSRGGANATDNCGSVTWSNNFAGVSDGCGFTGTATVTFTATDGCGNASNTIASFTIVDTTNPTMATQASNMIVECDGSGNNSSLNAWLSNHGGASASDICSGVTWSNNFTGLSDGCGATGTASVIFTATDACGNSSNSTASFTIVDTTNPAISTQAANQSVECNGSGNTVELFAWLANHGGSVASDACSGVTWTNDFTSLSDLCGATGSATVHFTVTDGCGRASTTTATFTIEDHTAPSGTPPAGTTGINSCKPTQAAAEAAFNAAIAASGYSDICGGPVTATMTLTTVSGTDCSWTVNYTFKVRDACGNERTGQTYSNSGSDQIGGPTTSTISVNPASQQYSDRVTFSATITNGAIGCGCYAATGITFFVGAQNMGSASFTRSGNNLVASVANVALLEGNVGQMSPGVKSVSGTLSGINTHYTVNQPSNVNLTITQENATVDYNGQEHILTPSPTGCTGTVTLSSNVHDAADGNPGDIRKAMVTFYRDIMGGAILGPANQPVSLPNPLNTQNGVGTSVFSYTINATNCAMGGDNFIVWTNTSNYYTGGTGTPPGAAVVELALPGTDFVTGGGHYVLSNSSGSYAGTAGSNMSFGLNIKWAQSGHNLDGNPNIIFRRLVSGAWKTYQIKADANKIQSMSIDLSDPAYRKAIISSKATFIDITNPASPVTISGNQTVDIQVWESTTVNNGSLDKISVALSGSGNQGLLFSSYWNGSATVPQNLTAGKIKVRSNAPSQNLVINAPTVDPVAGEQWQQTNIPVNTDMEQNFLLHNQPNPFKDQTTIGIELGSTNYVSLRVLNSMGQLVTILFEGILDKGLHQYTFDSSGLPSGFYFYTFNTGDTVQSGRMILER